MCSICIICLVSYWTICTLGCGFMICSLWLHESFLHDIDPTLVDLRGLLISKVNNVVVDVPKPRTFVSEDRHQKITEDILAERFGISTKRARATLDATLQRGTRSAILPLSQRYKADRQFKLHRLDGRFATDTLYADKRSLLGNTHSQVYSHPCGFSAVYHMANARSHSIADTLSEFVHHIHTQNTPRL